MLTAGVKTCAIIAHFAAEMLCYVYNHCIVPDCLCAAVHLTACLNIDAPCAAIIAVPSLTPC